MSSPGEYIEKLIADAYKREVDQEENVFRSMPFFATTFGLTATAVGLARPAVGLLSLTPASLLIHGLLAAIFAAVIAGLVFLAQAISRRTFQTPMREQDLIQWRERLEGFYAAAGEAPGSSGAAIVADIRDEITRQLAKATEVARANNLLRIQARGRAATSLLVAIALVFGLFAAILVRDAGTGARHVADSQGRPGAAQSQGIAGSGNRTGVGEAGTPAHADRGAGSMDLPGRPAGEISR